MFKNSVRFYRDRVDSIGLTLYVLPALMGQPSLTWGYGETFLIPISDSAHRQRRRLPYAIRIVFNSVLKLRGPTTDITPIILKFIATGH
ncbi:MAG: hypothetical protein CMJ77_09365 [Planctomycetaceae bacterium]|nr:hypothetical protein [Planctomycetaceae bacterium]